MEDARLELTSPEPEVLEVSIAGEIDLRTVAPIRATVEREVRSGDYRHLVFDLEAVTFIDSSGYHLLADSSRSMAGAGGDVEVRCSSPHVLKVLSVLGLDRLFAVSATATT